MPSVYRRGDGIQGIGIVYSYYCGGIVSTCVDCVVGRLGDFTSGSNKCVKTWYISLFHSTLGVKSEKKTCSTSTCQF